MRNSIAVLGVLVSFVCLTSILGCSSDDGDCLVGDPSCASGSSSSGGSSARCGNTGEVFFKEKVSPILSAVCAQCHSSANSKAGPDFLGSSSSEYYRKLTFNTLFVGSNASTSVLLKQGEHTGPAFTPEEYSTVADWLNIEGKERSGDCMGTEVETSNCKSPEILLAEFGACMTLEDWTANNMHKIATQTSTYGQCYGCHSTGLAGNYMTNPVSEPDIILGFENMRVPSPIVNLVAWPQPGDGGECPDITPSYRWRDKGQPGNNHPKYNLAPAYEAALEQWFSLTYTKWKNGPCVAQ